MHQERVCGSFDHSLFPILSTLMSRVLHVPKKKVCMICPIINEWFILFFFPLFAFRRVRSPNTKPMGNCYSQPACQLICMLDGWRIYTGSGLSVEQKLAQLLPPTERHCDLEPEGRPPSCRTTRHGQARKSAGVTWALQAICQRRFPLRSVWAESHSPAARNPFSIPGFYNSLDLD